MGRGAEGAHHEAGERGEHVDGRVSIEAALSTGRGEHARGQRGRARTMRRESEGSTLMGG